MLERQICVKYDLKKMLGHSQQEDPQKSEKGEVIRSKRPVRLSSLEALFQAGGGDQGEEPRKGLLPIFSFLKRKCYSFLNVKSLQSCPTLCNSVDCKSPGSSVHGTLWVKILGWVALPSSKASSPPRGRTRISYVSCIGR